MNPGEIFAGTDQYNFLSLVLAAWGGKPASRLTLSRRGAEALLPLLDKWGLARKIVPRAETADAFSFESAEAPNRYILTPEDLAEMRVKDQYLYVSRDEAAIRKLEAADKRADPETVADVLGYPRCCARFYPTVRRASDVACVKAAARNSGAGPYSFLVNVARGGYTLLLHFPYSFECRPSLKLGERYLKTLRALDASYAAALEAELGKAIFVGADFFVGFPVDRPEVGEAYSNLSMKAVTGRRFVLRGERRLEIDGKVSSGRLLLFNGGAPSAA